MRKCLWLAPMLLLAACSRNQPSSANIQQPATESVQASPAPAAPLDADSVAEVVPEAGGMEIPSGTLLRVRVDEAISTRRNLVGDRFTATLAEPVIVAGRSVLPQGTRMRGHVLVSTASGRFKGRARLVLSLDSFERGGRRYRIDTTAASRISGNHNKHNGVAIGGGAGIGAAIGGIAAGGEGALIGAGAGAAAGTIGAAVTGKKQVVIPAETVLRFTLGAPVRV